MICNTLLFFGVLLVSTAWAQLSYCTSGPTTTTDSNLGLTILIGDSKTINDPTNCPAVTGVRDMTALSADIRVGGTYTLQYNVTTCGSAYPTVSGAWIDFDQNGTYDTTELLFPNNRSNGWISTSFVVAPTTPVKSGTTRMRVQVVETSSTNPLLPCATFTYGGTKDFTIIVSTGGGGSGSSSSSSMSGGSIFLIIVVIAATVYIIVGCIYNRARKGTTGMRESCPQGDIWCDLPGLMKDGCLFTKAKITGKAGGEDYNRIDDNL